MSDQFFLLFFLASLANTSLAWVACGQPDLRLQAGAKTATTNNSNRADGKMRDNFMVSYGNGYKIRLRLF